MHVSKVSGLRTQIFLMVDLTSGNIEMGKTGEIKISKMIKTGARELEGANSEFEANNFLTFRMKSYTIKIYIFLRQYLF